MSHERKNKVKEKYFSKDYLDKARDGKTITFKGKKYKVGKMSYGDYFFEPSNYHGGEQDPFHPKTLWLEKKVIKNQYGDNQVVFVVE